MNTNIDTSQNNRNNTDEVLHQKIGVRAYHIWLENGGGNGDHERHWLQAEKELMEATKRGRNPQSNAHSRKKTVEPH